MKLLVFSLWTFFFLSSRHVVAADERVSTLKANLDLANGDANGSLQSSEMNLDNSLQEMSANVNSEVINDDFHFLRGDSSIVSRQTQLRFDLPFLVLDLLRNFLNNVLGVRIFPIFSGGSDTTTSPTSAPTGAPTSTPTASPTSQAFADLKNLLTESDTALVLDFECFGSLPTEVGLLTTLKKLSLSENNLRNLPSEIGMLTALTELVVSFNQLGSLPTEIGLLTMLTLLGITENSLTSLPTEIGSLALLKILDAGNNSFTRLPTEIGLLVSLDRLGLNSNSLTSLPTEIGQLTSLEALSLGLNPLTLTDLPTEIALITSLDLFGFD